MVRYNCVTRKLQTLELIARKWQMSVHNVYCKLWSLDPFLAQFASNNFRHIEHTQPSPVDQGHELLGAPSSVIKKIG